jgi:DNA-binding IclR family transcriptional regulator
VSIADDSAGRASIDRFLRVIYHIAQARDGHVGVTEVAKELSLSKAVVHRILRGLVEGDFANHDEVTRRYSLGPGALKVGLATLRELDVPKVAHPIMQRLVNQTGETLTLSLWQGQSRVYVDQIVSPKPVRYSVEIGHPSPMYAGSSSKSILAALPREKSKELLDSLGELRALTENTIIDRALLEVELEKTRERGYAISFGERVSDAASVAAVIFQADGRVFGAMSLCGPKGRIDRELMEEYGELVRDAALEVSTTMGYRE